ncbi:ComEC/Rec2 family competence protein [Aquimarina brevivitae]|uniref:Competence protein ComEC n=1 Tax=Aquimarina brevivitae TaxID=323412 RepID=A0A4Q7PEV5_9FLAO|nr:ComEC/Rec2 family competence protein [Aquimarina brevivitae]RZS98964.1 competence protein ComEC [Aquimarina brevivitae]
MNTNTLQHTPFVLITIFTMIGVLLGYYELVPVTVLFFLLGVAVLLLITNLLLLQKHQKTGVLALVSIILFFTCFGSLLVYFNAPKNNPNHYTNHLETQHYEQEPSLTFEIKERLKPTSTYNRYIAQIVAVDTIPTQGKLLVKVKKSDSLEVPKIGTVYFSKSNVLPIEKPLNPDQFDYALYLKNKEIYHQIAMNANNSITIRRNTGILSLTDDIRSLINKRIEAYDFTPNQLSIINALLLGQRQDINKELNSNYQKAGLIHILAVSGLHVGLLYGILLLLLNPLIHFKKGKTFKLIIIIGVLWCFAGLTGFSPSVLRAVTMFSILGITTAFNGTKSILNAVFISAFLILLFQPLIIFDVGFQLSYCAVIAIVSIQPLLQSLYKPRFIINKKLWSILTVTLAAQLGILPLSLYYFHQFPILFFITNLLILPFLGTVVAFGILVIILALFDLLPAILVTLFGYLIDMINWVAATVASYDTFTITEIPFDKWMLVSAVVLLFATYRLMKKNSLNRKLSVVTFLSLFSISCVYKVYTNNNHSELIVYNQYKNSIVAVKDKQQLHIYHRDSLSVTQRDFLLKGYVTNRGILSTKFKKLSNVYKIQNKTIAVIDSSFVDALIPLDTDIILLSNSPQVNLNRVLTRIKPSIVIADASNYSSYIQRWTNSCSAFKVSFYDTRTNGAFRMKLTP